LVAAFKALKTPDDVARLLEVEPRTLRYFLHRAENYKTFEIRKRSGGIREISTPRTSLKIIQRKLNQAFHAVYGRRSPVHGFVRRRSIRTNARMHVGRNLVLNLDLEDFFPSIHFGRVKGLLESSPYGLPEEAALVVAQICCYKGVLPIGAPTSAIVANMICGQLDAQLRALAVRQACKYTRYADDITFSTDSQQFPHQIIFRDPHGTGRWSIGAELRQIIEANGFKANVSKVRVLNRRSCQEVTGLVTNTRLNVKRQYVRQVRAMLHAWEKWGEERAAAEFVSKYDRKQRLSQKVDFRAVVRGKVDFIGFVRGRDDLLFLKLLDSYIKLDRRGNFKTITIGSTAANEVLARAIWLLEDEEQQTQATAFAAEGYGLLTAFHAVAALDKGETQILASRPHIEARKFRIRIVRKAEHHDVAQIAIDAKIPIQLSVGRPNQLRIGQQITLAGFPNYHVGDTVAFNQGPITQERVYSTVRHWVIGPAIVVGNSGGPILDDRKRVVGIAVKGQKVPGRFSDIDELSSFVPVSALQFLK